MAKYVKKGKGNFNQVVDEINKAAVNGSMTASLEESSTFTMGNIKVAVRAYERYAFWGKNRVSLFITVTADDQSNVVVTAIATGGSQAVFLKVNTWSEGSFLNTVVSAIDRMVK